MADLHILRDHALGLAQARQLARQWEVHAQEKLGMTCTYEAGEAADAVHFARTGVQGVLSVTAAQFELKAQLGFLASVFKGEIEREIAQNMDKLLKAESIAKTAQT